MNISEAGEQTPHKPLRLWLGVVAVLLWLLRFGVPMVMPEATPYGMIGALLGGVALLLWWAFFSRMPWIERLGAVVLMIAAMFAAFRIVDKSIATGMMGFMFAAYSIPVLGIAFAAWAMFSRRLPDGLRRASMALTILLAIGAWTLLRTDGMSGDAASDFHWRWSKTREETLPALPAAAVSAKIPSETLAAPRVEDKPVVIAPPPVAVVAAAYWPGFRGPGRDSIIPGIRIQTDWSSSPPVQLWRRPIGPGWSSFAVSGELIYTQEQRGDDEVVACYNAATGNPVWAHRDPARFWESNAGAGPRATPTLHEGRVYTFGATGILNALDARDGAVLWSRNAASDTGRKIPDWGFASSPLVVGNSVIVATAGQLAAYDAATGAPRWTGPPGRAGYSSPHRMTIGGVEQILLVNGAGVTGVASADGKLLWEHKWPGDGIVQPAITAEGDVLIGTGSGIGAATGVRRIAVTRGPAGWTAEERWTTTGLKPYYNDFVVHNGHVYGFDGGILSCIDAKDGRRKWKGGRYGHGQLLLVRDQSLLLVLSEEGEIAVVNAVPDQFTEVARFPALEGKTWNHPVLAGDRLFVRNSEEMAAFRLPPLASQ